MLYSFTIMNGVERRNNVTLLPHKGVVATLGLVLTRALWVGCFLQNFTTGYAKFMLKIGYTLYISMDLSVLIFLISRDCHSPKPLQDMFLK